MTRRVSADSNRKWLLLGLALAALSCARQVETPQEEQLGAVAASTTTCVLGQECCPAGYTQVTLTQNSDSFSTITANQCIVALGGSDIMAINGSNDIVLAGDGDDNVFAGPTSLVRAGNGNAT